MIDAGGARPRDDLDGLIEHLVDAERRLTVAFAKAGVDSSVLNDMRLLSNAAVALRGLRWRIAALEAENADWIAAIDGHIAVRLDAYRRAEVAEADRDHWREARRAAIKAGDMLLERITALEAERDTLAKDAERYRWLRDVGDKTWTPFCQRLGWHGQGFNMDRRIDAAIDAARSKP
jgi:hypothetical protein